jgi:hypothetical protein
MLVIEIAVGIVLGYFALHLLREYPLEVLWVVGGLIGLGLVGLLALYWLAYPEDFRTAVIVAGWLALFLAPFVGAQWLFDRWRARRRAAAGARSRRNQVS